MSDSSTSPTSTAAHILPSLSTVDQEAHAQPGLHEDRPSLRPRRETPDVSHAMEDVNTSHRTGRERGTKEQIVAKEGEHKPHHHPHLPRPPSRSRSRSRSRTRSRSRSASPSSRHPDRPQPTLYDRLEGSATEAWAYYITGDKQEEEAGRMLKEYGREALEHALKRGDGGALG